ncbi:DUF2835 domain-containing protein [Colwellia sp. D2M02]|uniref:DUF2835 domain-containing protein n=1 Tax=Colwellia asteriadis TaxID=517723 RepID=A0ABN1L8R1_9GAMM|nr:DUF2835 domain-containing protein [Colwellia sp. D2M02]MBU2894120.1 DUF2835 domain-containing protein [Colwellia sp. D2M02]
MKYYFTINMSAYDFLPYYQGHVESIVATTTTGVRVQFPAMHLRQHVTSIGIKGYFCLETQNNKFLALTKIS